MSMAESYAKQRQLVADQKREQQEQREQLVEQQKQKQKDMMSMRDKKDKIDMENGMFSTIDTYRIITGGYGDNPLGGGLFRKIADLIYGHGFIPIGGLTIDSKGKSYQVMYRNDVEDDEAAAVKPKTKPIESSLIDLTDTPTIPIKETLAGVFNSNIGGKRNKKKSKKYISKRKNKTKKRN